MRDEADKHDKRDSTGRVDFHLHSHASNVTDYYAANALSIPESYSEPPELYEVLKRRGMSLALSNPVYAAFAERRHTGKWGRGLGLPFWVQSWRYAAARLCSPRSALFTMGFGSRPHVSAAAKERKDWRTPGSCGACTTKGCCKMASPWGTAEPCPHLRGDGCSIYGGLVWRVGPCGRYPENPDRVSEYGCPRFDYDEARVPRVTTEKGKGPRHRVRLPVVPARGPEP